jgi:Outer membrane protein beta-barrel domain
MIFVYNRTDSFETIIIQAYLLNKKQGIMKYTFTALLLLLGILTKAQTWHYGAKADINLSGISGNGMSSSFVSGAQIGGFLEIDKDKKWGLQPELLFTQSNSKKGGDFLVYYNTNGNYYAEDNIKLSYLNIPVLLRYNLTSFLTVLAGPQVGFLLYDNESLRQDGQGAFKKYEVSGNAGLQFNISSVALSARYNVGLSNINDIDNRYKWTSRHLQLGIAIKIK